MAKKEFREYIAEVKALRDEYRGRINVLVGVESDFFPDHVARYRRIYAQYDLDYIIGSVHVLGGVDVFRKGRWEHASSADLKAARELYCDMVARSARSGMFDVLGHIDVIKANCPEIATIDTPAVDRMLREIAAVDIAIEVNTSGKTKDCGGWYPSADILERAQRYGIKLTFGSDAHDPERVGDEHESVRDALRALGFRSWYMFERRKRIGLPL